MNYEGGECFAGGRCLSVDCFARLIYEVSKPCNRRLQANVASSAEMLQANDASSDERLQANNASSKVRGGAMMLRPLLLHYVLKQFSVRTKARKHDSLLARLFLFDPNQKSVAFNMTFHVSYVVPF